MRRARVRAGSILLLSSLLLSAAPVHAAPRKSAPAADRDDQVEQLALQAQEEFKKGDYQKSADLLLKAYDIKPVSKLLYNIARTYEKANDTDKAMRFYQRYLDTPGGEPELVQKCARALDALRAEKLKAEYAEKQRMAEEQRKAADAQRQADEERERLARDRQQLASGQQGKTSILVVTQKEPSKVLPVTVLSVSALALASGIYFGLDASGQKDRWSNSLNLVEKKAFADSARSSAHLADISFGVSAVAAAAGGYLLFSALHQPQPVTPGHVSVVPGALGQPGVTLAASWGL